MGSSGGKGGGSATIGYRYFMSIHMGLCRGPIDEIAEIRVGGLTAHSAPITGGQTSIEAPNLFGGDKKEGGIHGTLTMALGDDGQAIPNWWKSLMGGTVPDFRGVTTVLFDGLICSLNPYPKTWKFRIRRTLSGWDGPVWVPELATIWMEDGLIKAMNPAHILYECATNRTWGRGLPRELIGTESWVNAAIKLYSENFGLCLRWNRQDSLQDFVQVVLDHIGGTLYINRETGLLDLYLIRDGYDPSAVPLLTYNTGLLSVEDGETQAHSDAVNEIVVKYRSPIDDQQREVRAQNLASIQSVGAINSSTIDYSGIPTYDLAARVAQRDLRINTSAVRRYKITADRRAWRLFPGALFRISAPDKGIANLVLRAGKVTDGTLTNGQIAIDAVIDVFGLSVAAFTKQQDRQWVSPDTSAVPITYAKVNEATYRDMVRSVSPAELALVDVYSGAISTMAVKPSVLALNYGIATRTGATAFAQRNTEVFVPAVVLSAPVGPYDTILPFETSFEIGLAGAGDTILLGDELVRLDAINLEPDGISGTLSVSRGCVDTIPAPHSSGEMVFFVGSDGGSDLREYVSGETVDVKLLTITSTKTLALAFATTNSIVISGRQGRPYPPGDVRVNGMPCFDVTPFSGDMTITWAHRHRLLQSDQIVPHEGADIGPEEGVLYKVRVYSTSDLLLEEILTTSNSVDINDLYTGLLRIELEAVRGTIRSFQMYNFTVQRDS